MATIDLAEFHQPPRPDLADREHTVLALAIVASLCLHLVASIIGAGHTVEPLHKAASPKPATPRQLDVELVPPIPGLPATRAEKPAEEKLPPVDKALVKSLLTNAGRTLLTCRDCRLAGADFKGAYLRLGSFQRADMRKAKFTGADLTGAKFAGANFRLIEYVRGLKLRNVDARHAIFRYAVLRGVDFTGADLSGADFTRALGLTNEHLARACGDDRTRLPPGLVIPRCASPDR